MKVRFFNPGLGYLERQEEIDSEIHRVLAAGDLILRGDVEDFEENLARFVGTKYAVALNSGTDALYLSLWAAGIGPGDEVITSGHTFVATVQVIKQLGATPILVDIESDGLMSDEQMVMKINRLTKAIIPVHLTGLVNKQCIKVLNASWPEIKIVEDACQALGAVRNPTSLTQCWSFYPAKILGAYGDAGAITTNDENIANEIREMRNHYKKDYSKWGINSRMDNLQAAVLNVKMRYLEDTLQKRTLIAIKYFRGLKNVMLPKNEEGRVWQDFVIRSANRDGLFDYLKIHGIETMKNDYPFPIDKPEFTKIYESETLRLPINEVLTEDKIDYVIEKVNKYGT